MMEILFSRQVNVPRGPRDASAPSAQHQSALEDEPLGMTRPSKAIHEPLDRVVVLDLVEWSPVPPRQVQEPLVDRMWDVGDFTVPHPMASR